MAICDGVESPCNDFLSGKEDWRAGRAETRHPFENMKGPAGSGEKQWMFTLSYVKKVRPFAEASHEATVEWILKVGRLKFQIGGRWLKKSVFSVTLHLKSISAASNGKTDVFHILFPAGGGKKWHISVAFVFENTKLSLL